MKNEKGFTTLELMVSIGIIAILTAIAVPSYINWLPGYRLRSAASDVHSAMQLARLRAVKENGRVGIAYTSGKGSNGKFKVFFDRNNSDTYDPNDSIIKYGEMPGSVRISAPIAQSMFNGRGLVKAGGAGTITLTNSMGSTKRVILIVTGSSRIS